MAPTQATSARVQRLTSLAAIVLIAASVGMSFGRVFEGGTSSVRMVAMGVASAVIAWTFERRSLLLATLVSGLLVVVGLGLAVFPSTIWYGLPTIETLRAMGAAAIEVGEQARLQIAPAPPVTPLVFASATAIWAAVFSCHSLAFRAGSPLLSLVPPAALVVFADSVLEDLIRPMYGVAFLVAAMSIVFADSLRRVQGWGPVWSGPGRRDRLLPAAGRGARRIAGAAVLVAVAAPLLVPGFGGRAVFDLSDVGGDEAVRVSTLVSIAGELTGGEDKDAFIARSPAASYWRITSHDYFDGVHWLSSAETPVQVTPGSALGEAPEGTSVTQSFEVTNDLLFPWLPAAYVPTSIDLDGDVSWYPGSETATIQGHLEPGDSYTVTSTFVEATPEELRQVPAPPPPDDELTDIPDDIAGRLEAIAEQWTAGAETTYDKVYAIQEHLLSDYTYSKDVSLREDAMAIMEFLTIGKRGICQQFAGSMAVLLRSIDIPARVAVGFTTGDLIPGETGAWNVTTANYHAWVEVPFEGYGWLAFEPTPTRENPAAPWAARDIPPACARPNGCGTEPPGKGASNDPIPPDRDFGANPRRAGPPLEPGSIEGGSADGSLGASSVGTWISFALLAAAAIAVLAFLLTPALRHERRRRAIRSAGPSSRRIVLAIYDACCQDARDLGEPRRLGETPEEYAWRLSEALPEVADRVGRLSGLVERAAYGPRELTPDEVLDAEADAREIARALGDRRTWRDRLPRRRRAA